MKLGHWKGLTSFACQAQGGTVALAMQFLA